MKLGPGRSRAKRMLRAISAAFRNAVRSPFSGLLALHRWWTVGRRYRPEQAYMRGGGRGDRALAAKGR